MKAGDRIGIATVSNLVSGVTTGNDGDVAKTLGCDVLGWDRRWGLGRRARSGRSSNRPSTSRRSYGPGDRSASADPAQPLALARSPGPAESAFEAAVRE